MAAWLGKFATLQTSLTSQFEIYTYLHSHFFLYLKCSFFFYKDLFSMKGVFRPTSQSGWVSQDGDLGWTDGLQLSSQS